MSCCVTTQDDLAALREALRETLQALDTLIGRVEAAEARERELKAALRQVALWMQLVARRAAGEETGDVSPAKSGL